MPAIPMRFNGGALEGKMLWVEDNCMELNVQVAGEDGGAARQLLYRRQGDQLLFVGETEPEPRPARPPAPEPRRSQPGSGEPTAGFTMANWFGPRSRAP